MIRRVAGVIAGIVSVVLLTACATIPVSGPVETAPAQVEQNDPGFVYVPNPPVVDASPENIVVGFIQAASAGGGYSVAKKFLTAGFAKKWDPDEKVLVHTASWTTTQQGDDQVRLDVPVSATVNDRGVYQPTSQSKPLDFGLEKVRGQWRIASGPDGVVLSQPAFLRVFKSVSLKFFDGSWTRFVPDRRWFPSRTYSAPDTVAALLQGQAPPLVGITRSAFPVNTELLRPVRALEDRTAVDLVVPGAQPDEQTTNRMQQQLADSLDVSTSSVKLTVNGRQVPTARQTVTEQVAAIDPVVVAGARFGTLNAAGVVQEEGDLGPRIASLRPTAVTFSARQRLASVLTRDGTVALVDRTRIRPLDRRDDLIAPTIDQQGWTYSVPADDPSGLQLFDSSGKRSDVELDLGGVAVSTIEVSPDGTRLLVLHERSDGPPEAYVAGIERDAKGRPVGLTVARYLVALGTDGASDATWVDQSQVAVLTPGALQNVVLQQLGGTSRVLGPLQGAQKIVGTTGQDDLRALLGSGAVAKPSSNAWSIEFPASIGVSVLVVQR